MRARLIVGNWKLHGTIDSITTLLDKLKIGITHTCHTTIPQVVVLPPAIFIPQVAHSLETSPIAWGGQNISEHPEGAYTGEISAAMLVAFSCRYALLGHSERRQYYNETDEQIARKLLLARRMGLTPILCLGETWQQYQSGQTEAVLLQQLTHYLTVGETVFQDVVLAYEPIWAIGTGESATPEYAQAVHHRLRTAIADHLSPQLAHQIRILYGGSIKLNNAGALFAMPDIDGGLVGSAALSADIFLQIYQAFP